MRTLVLAGLLLGLTGCFGPSPGCWETARAETWHQAAYWDWQPPSSDALEVHEQRAGPGAQWPAPPQEWRGNHSVAFVEWNLGDKYDVSVRDVAGEMHVWAFLPQKMKAAERAQTIRSLLQDATTASAGEVEELVAKTMAADDGGDSTGRFMVVPAPGLQMDLDRLEALGDWDTSQLRAGGWNLTHGGWRIFVNLDARLLSQRVAPYLSIEFDSGGYVRGPLLETELDAAERRNQTTSFVGRLGAPAPTYEKAGFAIVMGCA